ncbi:hypothetical protein LCGC14_0965110 [marine sediment metagenome]|uniref:Uncharacterized protein n=1 Tax=marine sediment metagenome TaxID=412755 RepID=A0A0F9QWM3_9ZZZZ
MVDAEVLKELQDINGLITRKLAEAPVLTSQDQVKKEMLLQARVKIQEAVSAILRG